MRIVADGTVRLGGLVIEFLAGHFAGVALRAKGCCGRFEKCRLAAGMSRMALEAGIRILREQRVLLRRSVDALAEGRVTPAAQLVHAALQHDFPRVWSEVAGVAHPLSEGWMLVRAHHVGVV